MRILRISHSGVVAAWRGRDVALRQQGHLVHLLTATRWDEGGRVVNLTEEGQDSDITGIQTWGTHPALFVYDPRPLWRSLGEEWDVLDLHEEPFALASAEFLLLRWLRRVHTPYVIYSAQNIPKRYPVPFRWFERAILRHAAGVYPCNHAAAEIMQGKEFPGATRVVPLGFDPEVFRPDPSERRTSHNPGTTRIGYAGRLAEHKGVAILIAALELHPELSLSICGSGPQEAALRDFAAQLGVTDRVTFEGSRSGEALAAFYRTIDILAVPSLVTPSWIEQFCRVAVEAMASGTPVVATDSGALPEVVGEAGVIVPAGNPEALGHALAALADDPSRRADLGQRAIRRTASMTWAEVAADMADIFDTARHVPLPEPPPVHVVVVAFHRPDLLERALQGLRLPVTVVDNSSDPEVQAVSRRFGATYLDPGSNGGFGSGVNIALARLTEPADVLLLNPDARISSDDVLSMQSQLRETKDAGTIAAPQVDGRGEPARVMWPFPSPLEAWRSAIGIGRWSRPEFGIGSVLMLRAEALQQVGGFDESFFLYAEETDWAYRAARLGWRHVQAHGLTATHQAGATSADETRRQVHFAAGHERFSRKHFGAAGWTVTRAGVIVGAMTRWAVRPGRGQAHLDRARRYLAGPVRSEASLRPEKS